MWVANAQDGTISIVDLAQKKVTATLQANVRGANRLKFTPDGKLVLVSPGSALVVLDASTHNEVKRLPDVHASGGIQMQPDGARAYAACGRDNYVSVIDLKTFAEVGKIPVNGPTASPGCAPIAVPADLRVPPVSLLETGKTVSFLPGHARLHQ